PRATRWDDIAGLDDADVDRMPGRFVGGRNSWIAQTFVRLRRAIEARGWSATAGPGFPRGAICIAHRDDVNHFALPAHASFLVVVRADRAPVEACDLAIVQNALAVERHERFIPLWPQPGIVPRGADRGDRLERIAYLGRTDSAPPWFEDAGFRRALRARRVEFEVRTRDWADYRDVDIALAIRRELPGVLAQKPATKLYNGWLAGVPVLASPEPAYRELRKRAIDFIEVRDATDVLRAVDIFRANPGLYRAMAANGLARGAQFGVHATRARWMELLEREVVPRFMASRSAIAARASWFAIAMARQKARSRAYRVRCGLESWMRDVSDAMEGARERLSRGAGGRLDAKASRGSTAAG
ncbi:MAG TPA: glycosyltransferase, partial [Usitatibacter sp.]|nr:glycosyltransferase [Usitatibacter sp.]